MVTTDGLDYENSWRTFLMDAEIAKHYKAVNMAAGLNLPAPNPILESLLPSLLYIRLGALLDEIFEGYIASANLNMSKQYRNDFNGRIDFLKDQRKLFDAAKLHALRLKRNEIAHNAERSCTWIDLDDAITIADVELQHLGVVSVKPQFEFYAERHRREQPEPTYSISVSCCYGLKIGETKIIEVSWIESFGKSAPQES